MPNGKEPSKDLLTARRALEGLKNYKLIRDLEWDQTAQKWTLICELVITANPTEFVPQKTLWHVLIGEDYPLGPIDFFPSKNSPFVHTFQHQELNKDYTNKRYWRMGKLCLTASRRTLEGRVEGGNPEPLLSDERLYWHIMLAQKWLEDAAQGRLSVEGDYFELPQIDSSGNKLIFGFREDERSFSIWKDRIGTFGHFHYSQSLIKPNLLVVDEFFNNERQKICSVEWGDFFNGSNVAGGKIGCWILLNRIPVIKPWQCPLNWRDLRSAFKETQINLDDMLKSLFSKMRDDDRHVALVGFPVAEMVGQPPTRIHWLAISLPTLSNKGNYRNGFGPNEEGYWLRDRDEIVGDIKKIDWIDTENLAQDEMLVRGKYSSELSEANILIMGAGAIGSMIAEYLVRGGATKIKICDPDFVATGNLSRHILTMEDIGKRKASAVAERIRKISPLVTVEAFDMDGMDYLKRNIKTLNEFDLIIDSSTSDDLLAFLEGQVWEKNQNIISVSVGYAAKRLYAYFSPAEQFKFSDFSKSISKYLDEEKIWEKKFPREGIGCWHNVFPAKGSDIALMASKAVNLIDEYLAKGISAPDLVVLGNDLGRL